MILGIDAHNLRSGGAITHIYNLFKYGNFDRIEKVFLFSYSELTQMLRGFVGPKVEIISDGMLDQNCFARIWWNNSVLPQHIMKLRIDVLFSPGGLLPIRPLKKAKTVTMFRNFELFQNDYFAYSKISRQFLRILLLRKMQLRSFNQADGIIFLSRWGKHHIENLLKERRDYPIIYHGIDEKFFAEPRRFNVQTLSEIRLLYVSTFMTYKHHKELLDAISILEKKYRFKIMFVGPGPESKRRRLEKYALDRCLRTKVQWLVDIPYWQMPQIYAQCDIFVFASSCENCPNTLLEAMASGLPIACSNCQPMPEFAEDSVEYFDPGNPKSIALALTEIIESTDRANILSKKAHNLARKYSWQTCAKKTLDFIISIHKN